MCFWHFSEMLIPVLFLIFSSVSKGLGDKCDSDWVELNSYCYGHKSKYVTFQRAIEWCAESSANVLSVNTQEEQNFVESLFVLWKLDFNYDVWLDAKSSRYSYFDFDPIDEGKKCAVIYNVHQGFLFGHWFHSDCKESNYLVCKKWVEDPTEAPTTKSTTKVTSSSAISSTFKTPATTDLIYSTPDSITSTSQPETTTYNSAFSLDLGFACIFLSFALVFKTIL